MARETEMVHTCEEEEHKFPTKEVRDVGDDKS